MQYYKRITTLLFFSVALCVIAPFAARADFDPNFIIGDQEIYDEASMSLEEITAFLNAKGGFIATYTVTDPEGRSMSAAQAIYERSRANHVNPKFIMVLLQKEQSLIEDKSPSQSQLDWAAGYGCPDGGGCNERWRGLWKQINSSSLQFRDYMDNPQLYRYRVGQTYTIQNTGRPPMSVTPQNLATAALYNYTPHVYNGNFNFWKIWQRFFARDYLNGSLLQVSGESGVWLIENGMKRPFLTRSALTSRFDPTRVQIVSRADLDKYPKGDPIKFAQYSIVRIPNGRIYLLVDDHKRRFVNPAAFKKMGFNPDEIINVQEAELNSFIDGAVLTETSTYPTGALLQDKKTGGVYWVNEGIKQPLIDASLLRTKFKTKRIIKTTEAELATYSTGDPVRLSNGDIVRSPSSPAVYIIENGLKRPVNSADTFSKLGYKWSNVFVIAEKILQLHGDGAPVTIAQ